jgi:hypothetical protein
VLLLLEVKNSVVKVNPARSRVPAVSVVVDADAMASASVTVIPEPLIVTLLSVLALLVTVLDAINVGTTDVNMPPEARVRFPAMFNPDAVTEQALPVKFKFLK